MSLSRSRNGTHVTKLLWKLAVTFRDLFAHSCDLQNRHCTEAFHGPSLSRADRHLLFAQVTHT